MADRASRLAPGEVRAWHAAVEDLARDPAQTSRYLAWLQPVERTRYDRFRADTDRLMFLLGRVMARELVGWAADVPPTSWEWREGTHGRPEIGGLDPALQFNLAHSAGLVVCAVAHSRAVGVDVEDRRRAPIDWNLVERYCSPDEVTDIKAQGDRGWHDRFLTYWTLKEAYLKARGVGISVPLADVSFTLERDTARVAFLDSLAGTDTRWAFLLTQPTERHLVAVATSCENGVRPAIHVEPMTLKEI